MDHNWQFLFQPSQSGECEALAQLVEGPRWEAVGQEGMRCVGQAAASQGSARGQAVGRAVRLSSLGACYQPCAFAGSAFACSKSPLSTQFDVAAASPTSPSGRVKCEDTLSLQGRRRVSLRRLCHATAVLSALLSV